MRVYKRKTNRKPFTDALFEQAKSLMKKGVTIRQAAKAVGFSHTALRKRLKDGRGTSKLGRFRNVFTNAQEEEIYRHCVELDKRFFGLSLKSLRFLLYTYAKKNGITSSFSDESKMAGRDFTRSFMKRWKLSLRTPRKTSIARTMGFNRQQLNVYFSNLEETLQKYKFGPQRIYNMDESGVQTVPNKIPKHIAPTGKKEVAKSVSAEQGKTVTVVCAMSAVGHYIPPFFIYARKRENRLLIKGGPVGCDMALTERGYMNTETFVKWLTHFKKFSNPSSENPVLLILDNHISHISLMAIDFAKSNSIHLLTLPPHSSHKTQPLDRCFFRPFKAYYDSAADNWIVSRPGQAISEFEVAELVKIAFERAATVETAVQGFRSTGIHPFDKDKFTDADFLPSEVTDQEPDQEEGPQEDDQRFICFNDDTNGLPQQNGSQENHQLQCESTSIQVDAFPDLSIGEASSPKNSDPHFDRPGTSHDWLPSTSPKDIIPLPKIKIKRKRSGRGLKSVLLTSTPHKKHLEELQQEKEQEKITKSRKLSRALLFPPERPKLGRKKQIPSPPVYTSSDDESSYSVHNSSSDLEGLFSEAECDDIETTGDGNQETENLQLQVDDFAIVKVQGKTKNSMRLYVSKILRVLDQGYDGLFYKRIPQTQRFSETDEEAYLAPYDIHKRLSKPVMSSSSRFLNTISFSDDLSGLTIY